ncbi:MAG: Long-chain-fatty-acid--CoA ligase FadD15 [Bacteroidota bacterium]|nr:MAG: Long-chain-fatty-acid--CoA ligase FadD15 [Bacteroidota bacterium]
METPKRLFDFIDLMAEHRSIANAVNSKVNGKWVGLSTKETKEQGDRCSAGLLSLGVNAGDKIAIISSTNRTEWVLADFGMSQIGAINIPIYPTISAEDYAYILNHAEATYCFVSDKEVLDKLSAVESQCPKLKGVFSFDKIKGRDQFKTLLSKKPTKEQTNEISARKAAIKAEDLATIIYTSGTTGKPKGVMLSHNNIVSNVIASQERLPLEYGEAKSLSFLPLCHIYERMLLYLYFYSGTKIYFAESLETIGENLKEVNPSVMTAVPRLLEKLYDKIYARGAELSGIKQKLFYWAVDLGLRYEPYGQNGWWYEAQLKLARKLIFSKWKEALGGNLDLIASGSAALQPRLARVFTAAGMTVAEGYGLTETSPVISVNDMRNGQMRIGSVGPIISGVEVKIAEDGEILCKGPNVMMGYYKDQEKTNEVLKDGYFHTGDIGVIDADGFLKITDRKKEMFKTSGGKYIAPQVIENAMKQSIFIDQIMVVGEGQKFPAALIQPNFETVEAWAAKQGISLTKNEVWSENKKIHEKIFDEVNQINKRFGQWEKVKEIRITDDVWSVEEGHLTPTMKLKRKSVKEKYQTLFNSIYDL